MKSSLVLIMMVVCAAHGAGKRTSHHQQEFGADLKGVNAAEAKRASGIDRAGVLVVKVSTGGIADDLGLRSDDVIQEINDTRTLAPKDVTATVGDGSVALSIKYARAGRLRVSQRSAARDAAIRVAFIGSETSDTAELLRSAGLTLDCTPNVPGQLGSYEVVVLENERVCKPELNDRIRAYLKRGGGIVLVMGTPAHFAGLSKVYNARTELALIADWFGCAAIYGSNEGEQSVLAAVNRPFGTSFRSGERLMTHKGGLDFGYLKNEDLNERAEEIASWATGGVAALRNRYTEGRVYWQEQPTWPDNPKLGQLFIAGVRWAAGK